MVSRVKLVHGKIICKANFFLLNAQHCQFWPTKFRQISYIFDQAKKIQVPIKLKIWIELLYRSICTNLTSLHMDYLNVTFQVIKSSPSYINEISVSLNKSCYQIHCLVGCICSLTLSSWWGLNVRGHRESRRKGSVCADM